MIRNKKWPKVSLTVHTMNSVGRINMCAAIEHYGPYAYRESMEWCFGTVPLPAVRYTKE